MWLVELKRVNVHSGPTPRGREASEDLVSAAHPVAAARERSRSCAESVMFDGYRQ
jgi:hypothetical protein